jgi:hypothetical protein
MSWVGVAQEKVRMESPPDSHRDLDMYWSNFLKVWHPAGPEDKKLYLLNNGVFR